MREKFLKQLIKLVDPEKDYFLTADVGFGHLEPFQEKMGDHFINVGIREQAMISVATGLALSGYRVFTYTMCAFYLRALEQVRNDVGYHNANVKMIGVGVGREYGYLGFTHWAENDDQIIQAVGVNAMTLDGEQQYERAIDHIKKKEIGPLYLRVPKK